MTKTIKNKIYNEFWKDDNPVIKNMDNLKKKISDKKSTIDIKKMEPVNKPRGWHVKNIFIDNDGNEFNKGVFVENIKSKKEPKIIDDIIGIKRENQYNILTEKDIYQQYITEQTPFKIFFRGKLIFDSKLQPQKNYPNFQNNGFILFGKNYIYRGIRIEKY